jgi:hypothetical protein
MLCGFPCHRDDNAGPTVTRASQRPRGTKWQGAKLKAEIEVKGMRYPVRWACHQKLNDDGSLTLRPNLRQQV